MDIVVGLDIGGTKLLVAAADRSGVILRRAQRPTPLALAEGLDTLRGMVEAVRGDDRVVAFGAAAGGPLDYERGVVSPLHQPAWREVPLRELFEQAYGCPLAVDVDTNVAALGEYRWGGYPADRLLYLTLSTGMGGGLVVDGQIYRGARGEHPEVGHQAIPFRCAHPERVCCECGLDDCLEALVSGNAIRRIYGRPAEQLAPEQWAEVAYNLGQGLRNMATFYAPEVIAIGGGVAVGGGAALIDAARQHMADHLRLVQPPLVRLSTLGYDTALYGTIALALDAERTAAR